jgi:hypothetical protein
VVLEVYQKEALVSYRQLSPNQFADCDQIIYDYFRLVNNISRLSTHLRRPCLRDHIRDDCEKILLCAARRSQKPRTLVRGFLQLFRPPRSEVALGTELQDDVVLILELVAQRPNWLADREGYRVRESIGHTSVLLVDVAPGDFT